MDRLEMTTNSDIIETNMFTCFKRSSIDTATNKEWREGVQ